MRRRLFPFHAAVSLAAVATAVQMMFFAGALRGASLPASDFRAPKIKAGAFKPVSFEMLDDYSKGDDLAKIALDFQL
jgi:hypothetical protein